MENNTATNSIFEIIQQNNLQGMGQAISSGGTIFNYPHLSPLSFKYCVPRTLKAGYKVTTQDIILASYA